MIALTTTSIAWLLFAIIFIGWLVYLLFNIRQSRDELGSEIELAPNRKPYYDDDVMEGKRLDRVLGLGVLLLAITVVALPIYWVLEPDRQAGAAKAKEDQFVEWGALLFAPTGSNISAFNCAGCHGGMKATGGVAQYNLTNPATGEVKSVTWVAPALNTIYYRFSEEEIRYILTYGRPFSPMPAWGVAGGGPMNDQQIDTLLAYLKSIQIERQDCGVGEDDPQTCPTGHLPDDIQQEIESAARKAVEDGDAATYGEALYNLSMASGAYSCARCHTPGWSYGDPGVTGQGALGWNITGGSEGRHFPVESDLISFIKSGSTQGAKYGTQGQGTGRMPGFGNMLTDEQVSAIVEYIRSL